MKVFVAAAISAVLIATTAPAFAAEPVIELSCTGYSRFSHGSVTLRFSIDPDKTAFTGYRDGILQYQGFAYVKPDTITLEAENRVGKWKFDINRASGQFTATVTDTHTFPDLDGKCEKFTGNAF